MSSGSKEATADGFTMADIFFDLNYTVCSLFFGATKIIHLLLNLRVSSKGRGSARSASSSVSWTQSQESQGEMTVTRSNITLFLSAQSFLRQGDWKQQTSEDSCHFTRAKKQQEDSFPAHRDGKNMIIFWDVCKSKSQRKNGASKYVQTSPLCSFAASI